MLSLLLLLASPCSLPSPTPAPGGDAPPQYTLTDVSVPGQTTDLGQAGLSNTGLVCGWLLENGRPRGFLWSPGSVQAPSAFTLLDPPPEWGDYQSTDVNAAGVVIGTFGTRIGGLSMSRGYRWKAGVPVELFTTTGLSGIPIAINDAGWIVGMEGGRLGGPLRGLSWSPDLVPTVLEDLSAATDINELGEIVGYRTEGTQPVARAYLLDRARNVIPLGTLDPRDRGNVVARAINARGAVVGSSRVAGVDHAFLWTRANGMTELPGLYPSVAGDSIAQDINDGGWIVGSVPGPTGPVNVVWTPDGIPVELEPRVGGIGPGTRWSALFWAQRINAAGQIAGGGLSGTEIRSVLLTPATLHASAVRSGLGGRLNTLSVSKARPGRPVFLFGDLDDGLDRGYTRIPGCGPLGLALGTPRLVSVGLADAGGTSVHAWLAPPGLAGIPLRLQACQLHGCGLSNVVRLGP